MKFARLVFSSSLQSKTTFLQEKQNGVTLIELLVVIAIMGILASLVIVNLSVARERGRDAQRKADIKQIQAALEMYHAEVGSYPIFGDLEGCNSVGGWNVASDLKCSLINGQGAPAIAGKQLLKKIPDDPLWSGSSCNDANPNYLVASEGVHYVIFAKLENKNDADAVKIKPAPWGILGGTPFSPTASFTVTGGTCASTVYNYWFNSPS